MSRPRTNFRRNAALTSLLLWGTTAITPVQARQATPTPAPAAPAQAASSWDREVLPRQPQPFNGVVGPVLEESRPGTPNEIRAPQGAPNVLLILTDDIGFGAASTFGGPIPTPNLDRLAARGLLYNQFHTTGVCSPSRASLLTGRNPHAVATGFLTDIPNEFPGYTTEIPRSAATVAEILRLNGYNTAQIGKSHNTPTNALSAAGPFDRWPNGLGFDYFFGFMGGDSDQWSPRLYRGNSPSNDAPPQGQTLDYLLADDAVRWLRNQNAAAPDKPFLLYFAPGSGHAPHQVPAEWVDKFNGQFDKGWDQVRQETFDRQRRLGIIPRDAHLTPRPAELPAWDSLTPEEHRYHARQMQASAGMLAYQDAQIGRILDEIDKSGEADNTLILFIEGDNGSSGEGGPAGTSNEIGRMVNGVIDDGTSLVPTVDEIGGPHQYQNYSAAWAWAMTTPFQWMKQVGSHLGGITNGLIVSWPGHIQAHGEVRSQFSHLNDILPTILEAANIPAPRTVNGVEQQKIDGTSLVYSFDNAAAPTRHRTQYFELAANRSIYNDGWFANTVPRRLPWETSPPAGRADTSYEWQLYDLRTDYSQSRDLAASNPAKLEELKALFDSEARANNVYPLNDNMALDRIGIGAVARRFSRTNFHYWGKDVSVVLGNAPTFALRSFSVTAKIKVTEADQTGVLLAAGSWFGGWSFYLKDGRPTILEAVSQRPGEQYSVASPTALPVGPATVEYRFKSDGLARYAGGTVTILVDGQEVASGRIDRTILIPAGIGETFDTGRDTGVPVTLDYADQGVFAGDIDDIEIQFSPFGQ
jgi:arylsulfatase A-like enzyme